MTDFQLFLQGRGQGRRTAAAGLLAARASSLVRRIAGTLRAIEREAEARRAEAELAAMPDHMLKDIGVSRGAIRYRVRGQPD